DVLDPIAPPFYTSYTQTAALPTTVIARTHLSRVRQSAPLRTGNGAAAATRRSSATTDGFPSPACGKSSLRHAGSRRAWKAVDPSQPANHLVSARVVRPSI